MSVREKVPSQNRELNRKKKQEHEIDIGEQAVDLLRSHVIGLHRTVGNNAIQRMLAAGAGPGAPRVAGDPDEREIQARPFDAAEAKESGLRVESVPSAKYGSRTGQPGSDSRGTLTLQRQILMREEPPAGQQEAPKGAAPAGPAAPAPVYSVCARDLQGSLGVFANHCYIEAPPYRYAIITRCNATSGSDNVVAGTAATKTDVSPDPCSKTPKCVECVPKPGVTDLAKCFRDAFTAYNDPSLYKGLGPNSNTFAGTLARGCCANMTPKPKALGTVPGWDDAAAPARAATCPAGPPKC